MSAAGKHSAVSAAPRSRSEYRELSRLERRSPVRGEAPVQRLKRASPAGTQVPSGPRIRLTGDRPAAAVAQGKRPAERSVMSESVVPEPSGPKPSSQSEFAKLSHYCGFDWARKAHHVCVVVDKAGAVVLELSFADDAEGWDSFGKKLSQVAEIASAGVAIETSCGPEVERLLEMGLAVYPMNPKAASRYRDRKSVSGAKSDLADAFSFADGLRTDGHGWRRLIPLDPLTQELRILCRDEVALIEQRTALVNQLRATLREYYPAALEAFEQWTQAPAWRLVIAFPTPRELAKAGKGKWNRFLHANKIYRPETAAKRLEIFAHADTFASPNSAVTAAKSMLAVSLCEQLVTLERQLDKYRQRIQELFDDHPDHDLFGSLPGAGPKLAPRLMSELGCDRSVFGSAESLQCFAGTAPVTKQSGRTRIVQFRRACSMSLRAAVHQWCDCSRLKCAWAQAYYQKKREQRMNHAQALRCLGQRWLKILFKMWREKKPYDEARHTLDQVKHGSWVVKLLPESPAAQPA
jgi:transposase